MLGGHGKLRVCQSGYARKRKLSALKTSSWLCIFWIILHFGAEAKDEFRLPEEL